MEQREKVKQVVAMKVVSLKSIEEKKAEIIQIYEDVLMCVNQGFPAIISNLSEYVQKKDGYLAFTIDTLWTPENWRIVKEQVKRDAVQFVLSDSDEIRKAKRDQLVDLRMSAVIADDVYCQRDVYGIAVGVRKEIHEEYYADSYTPKLFYQMASAIEAEAGFIEYSAAGNSYLVGGRTKIQGLSQIGTEKILDFSDTLVPGYYWGLLLTKGHIRALGGVEYIMEKAPCYKIEEWEIGGEKALFLQLTEDIFKISKQQRLAYKKFLKPVLPEINYVKAAWEQKFYKNKRNEIIIYDEEEKEIINELAELSKEELLERLGNRIDF